MAATLALLMLTASGRANSQAVLGRTAGASASADGWRHLPDSPLAARDHAVAVGVDDRMLVVGG